MTKSWRLSERIRDEVARNGTDIKDWDKDTIELFNYVESQCNGPEWRAVKKEGWDAVIRYCAAMGR